MDFLRKNQEHEVWKFLRAMRFYLRVFCGSGKC